MNKTFRGDLIKIRNLLQDKVPFAFNRFSDGELFILQNKELILGTNIIKVGDTYINGGYEQEDHKHFDPLVHEFYKNKLIDAFRHKQPNYFKGISCPCCIGFDSFKWQLDFHGEYDENLTWANLFLNGNYITFINEVYPLFNLYKTVVVCNQNANLSALPFLQTSFRVGYNAMINDYDLIKKISDWIKNSNINGYLFLFSASTFSKLAIHQLYSQFPENTYIDIGTTLNALIGMSVKRGYLGGFWRGEPTNDLFKLCKWGEI